MRVSGAGTQAKRRVFHVTFNRSGGLLRWKLLEGANLLEHFVSKKTAVAKAIHLALQLHADGQLTQVVIHKKDGKIQEERTYGEDPIRSKG